MRRAGHRGAYEQLWSEQKFAVLAISSKRFMSGCRRLNQKAPRLLGFLDQLSGLSATPPAEPANAYLTVYGMVKQHLDRNRRRELVELLMSDPRAARDALFQDIATHRESALYGCRLFYPFEAGFKYWDLQEQTGLWVLLGPWLLHLGYPAVRMRLEASGIGSSDLDDRLRRLAAGIDRSEYESWPSAFRTALQRHCLVALPGYKAFLHPRVAEQLPLPVAAVQEEEPESAALIALERYWDEHPEDMPLLPETHEWVAAGVPDMQTGIRFSGPVDLESQIQHLREEFQQQAKFEGRAPDRRDNQPDEDLSDVGTGEDDAGAGEDSDDPLETLE